MFNIDNKTFIIAEAGVNHNGQLIIARQLVKAAKEAGADAVKFQTWKTDELIIKGTKTAEYQKNNTGDDDQYLMLKKLELSYDEFRDLKKYADEIGIMFLSTPDEEKSLNFLTDELDLPIVKIGSSELTNYLFLQKIGLKHKPMIISTGMGDLEEVKMAVEVIKDVNSESDLAILHCTSNYPCPMDEINLNVIKSFQNQFPSFTIGFSDHSIGTNVSLMAVALGAKIIEKHFTLDNNMAGPDHKASINPVDFKQMVASIREAEKDYSKFNKVLSHQDCAIILGSPEKKPTISEQKMKKIVRKIIVAKKDICIGSIITEDDITAKRSLQLGLTPDRYKSLLGKISLNNIRKDQAINIYNVK